MEQPPGTQQPDQATQPEQPEPLGYPISLTGTLDEDLNRWLFLVKWLLAIPHFLILAFLWVAFIIVVAIAFFAILFTGRYARTLFNFNLGVLRWSWRVGFYSYDVLGTDRYPPFTLADVEGYPARLSIEYPEQLSRGLVLIKWWLLAIPHYLITSFFRGGWQYSYGGLISLLAIIAAIANLFTERYPREIFDLVIGMNRWVYRVVGYASLMTDRYPPFRLKE